MSASILRLLCAFGLLATLAACGGGMGDLEQWVSEVKARKSTQVEPIPQIKPYEAYAYDAGTRRDPFVAEQPKPAAGSGPGPRPDPNRPKEALEEYPLDALRMQGIIRTPRATFGLIKSPDNIIHRVSVGNYMGQNFGQVKSVTETEITLMELVADGFGGYVQRPATLALSQ